MTPRGKEGRMYNKHSKTKKDGEKGMMKKKDS